MSPRAREATEQAWRHGYALGVTCQAYRGGQLLPVTLDVLDGGVQMTDAPGVRARLDTRVRSAPGMWDALAPGATLRPVLRTTYGQSYEDTRFGSFDVDEQNMTYDGAGVLSFKGCPDLWGRVQSRGLDAPATPTGNAVGYAVAAIRQALGDDVTAQIVAASTVEVGDVVYDDDREELVHDLLEAADRIAYIDRGDRLVVARPPTLTGTPVWAVDAFSDGVLVDAERSRSRRAVRNRVIVRATGGASFPQVTEDDTDPRSPTRVSLMGPRPMRVANPLIRTREQARIVARSTLRRVTRLGAQIDITAAPHWMLEPGDLIGVTLPAQNGDGYAYESHLIATVDHPFPTPGTPVVQKITTRSSRPDGGEDEVSTS